MEVLIALAATCMPAILACTCQVLSPESLLMRTPEHVWLQVRYSSRRKRKEAQEGSLYQHVEALWRESKAEMAAGRHMPRVDPAMQQCLATLPWWSKASSEALS